METVVQNVWSKSKLLVKSGIIGFIILILQIPAFYVTDLIAEREKRQKEAIAEVSSKWAGRQNIIGPVVVLPFWQTHTDTGGKLQRVREHAYFLPDALSINGTVLPQEKYRGIYKVMLYHSQLQLKGQFQSLPLAQLGISPQDVIWEEAYVTLNVSDTKGLNEELKLQVNNQALTLQPFREAGQGLKAPMVFDAATAQQPFEFSASFGLSGSQQLLFTPIGRSTSVQLKSTWPHPSFTGNVLPQTSTISDSGFTANWKSMGFKQHFPQQWIGDAFQLDSSASPASIGTAAFGADLFVPVNGYQKTMRSIKYSFLCLVLTFAAFFMIEISNRRSAHPFHYGLIGLALILFYTLLLSISEYISFNLAYSIAAACTIGLIAWFVRSLLASGKLTVLLASILVLLYGYVFTILQLQDYSLLLGSIGLFITLAVVMHFSKRFQW